jgi:hypothetical protein
VGEAGYDKKDSFWRGDGSMKNALQIKDTCIKAEIVHLRNFGLLNDVLYLLNDNEQNIIKVLHGLDGLTSISLEHYAKSTGMKYPEAERLRCKAFINFMKTAVYVWESPDY